MYKMYIIYTHATLDFRYHDTTYKFEGYTHIHTYYKHTRNLSLALSWCMCVSMYLCIYVSMYVCMYVCVYIYVCQYGCMDACMHVTSCGRLLCSGEQFNSQCKHTLWKHTGTICHTSLFINPALVRPPTKWPTLCSNLRSPTCFETWFPHNTNLLCRIMTSSSPFQEKHEDEQSAIRASPQLGAGWFTAFGSPGKKTQLISQETHIGALQR